MHILITGGAGFIGSNAARYFLEKGHQVTVLDNLLLGYRDNVPEGVTLIEADVRDLGALDKAGNPDIIIHLAGASSSPMFASDLPGSFDNNIRGHIAVLEFAKRVGAQKVLFASSSSIYGNAGGLLKEDMFVHPPNFYASTKKTQEDISRIFSETIGLPTVAFRFMSVYGPGEEHKGRFANLVSQFIWGMESGKAPVIYGDGTQTRDFTYVDDIVQAFERAIEDPGTGFEIFNVGTSEAWSVKDIIGIINEALGTDLIAQFVPNPIGSSYITTQQSDLSLVTSRLGYRPSVPLKEGIQRIVESRKKSPKPFRDLSF